MKFSSNTGSMSVAKNAVTIVWQIALCAAFVSLVLWINNVPQLQTWAATIPAIALVGALFAIVTSLRWNYDSTIPVRTVVATSALSAAWALAIAIGI